MVSDSPYTYEQVKGLHLPISFDSMKGRMKAQPAEETTNHTHGIFEKIVYLIVKVEHNI